MIRLTLIIAVCLQASGSLLAEDGKASVRVEVRSVDEQVWKDARIELFQQDKKTRVDVAFRNSVATGVPYGSYILRVFLPGFRKHEQTLGVNELEVFVRVYLAIAHIEDGGEAAPA